MQICMRVGRHLNACPPPSFDGLRTPSFETRPSTIASLPFIPFGTRANPLQGVQSSHDYNEVYSAAELMCTQRVPFNANPANPFGGSRQEACLDICDNCVSNTRDGAYAEAGTIDLGLCCRNVGAGCDNDADCCATGLPVARCVAGICRRGCNPDLQLNARVPTELKCGPFNECQPIQRGGIDVHACVPCGQQGDACCKTFGREACGAFLATPLVTSTGRYQFGDLQCNDQTQTCVRRMDCGTLGGPCCDPTRQTAGNGGRLDTIPQGSRCNAANAICGANNRCVACGGPNQPCCELALSQLNQQTAGVRLLANPPICNETRRPPPNQINPGRFCVTVPPGQQVSPVRCQATNLVCTLRGTPQVGGTCIPCGLAGQPCCEGQTCSSTSLTCNGNGTCDPCGSDGLRCCDCRGAAGCGENEFCDDVNFCRLRG